MKTRPTSQGNDLIKGLNGRFYYRPTRTRAPTAQLVPAAGGNGYTQGRNYWKHDATTNPNYGYQDNDRPRGTRNFNPPDPRLVMIFLTTPESFTGSGQNTYPITGAIGVYITGYGTVSGAEASDVDPVRGPPPPDLDLSGGYAGGRAVWGHFVNLTVLSAGATPSSAPCNPAGARSRASRSWSNSQ